MRDLRAHTKQKLVDKIHDIRNKKPTQTTPKFHLPGNTAAELPYVQFNGCGSDSDELIDAESLFGGKKAKFFHRVSLFSLFLCAVWASHTQPHSKRKRKRFSRKVKLLCGHIKNFHADPEKFWKFRAQAKKIRAGMKIFCDGNALLSHMGDTP